MQFTTDENGFRIDVCNSDLASPEGKIRSGLNMSANYSLPGEGLFTVNVTVNRIKEQTVSEADATAYASRY